eukprot:4614314-Alexandrium_andersonii.AAC.1
MSASLVGSEMCIRDRVAHAALVESATWVATRSRTAATGEQLKVNSALTVSYTHLTLPTICSV